MIPNTSRQSAEDIREAYNRLCENITKADASLQVFVAGTCSRKNIFGQLDELLRRYPDPGNRPPLFAIPVGIKDIFHCDGHMTKCGSRLPPELFQGPEATAVSQLRKAGAVVMGKTATTEFAYFAPAPTRNPRNIKHTPGGSSSGSAAGVAAGFFEYALGTQTVGSIIRPASYCGIVGFKPSLGRIATKGVIPFSWTIDHVGVFSKAVQSLEPVVSVLVDGWRPKAADRHGRFGIPVGPYFDQAEPSVKELFGNQVNQLAAAGYTFVDIDCLADIAEINETHSRLISAEIARVHAPWFEEHKGEYRNATREIIEKGMGIPDAEMERLRLSCLGLRKTISEKMRMHDVHALICPSTTSEAPLGLETTGSPLMNLPWTHAGLPVVTIPCGKGPGDLPLGLQLIGCYREDEHLVDLSATLESYLPGIE